MADFSSYMRLPHLLAETLHQPADDARRRAVGRRFFVIMTARLLQIVVGIAGLCALVLGLFIWIANSDLTDIHMLFGLLVTVGLLVMSIIALTARGLRIWGVVGIVYAIIALIFGVSQSNMLVGNLHWLIQTL